MMHNFKSCFVPTLLLLAGATQAMPLRSLEFEAGTSLMTQDFDYSDDFPFQPNERLFRGTGGAYAIWSGPFSPHLELRAGISYVKMGYQHSQQRTDENGNILGDMIYIAKMDMLVIPLQVQWIHRFENGISPFVRVGPSLDFIVRHDDDIILRNLQHVNLGIRMGAGVEYRGFHLAAEYQTDWTNAYEAPTGATLERVTNHGTLIEAGYDLLPLLAKH